MFLAVQCYQCSTMQAKQQKKSNNKWSCSICNEKQSFQKIFARSTAAKDIRKFVQDFNMSRQLKDAQAMHNLMSGPEEEIADINNWGDGAEILQERDNSFVQERQQSKWVEYLESQQENSMPKFTAEEEEEELDGIRVITDLSDVHLRKRKQKFVSRNKQSDRTHDRNQSKKSTTSTLDITHDSRTLESYGFVKEKKKKNTRDEPNMSPAIAGQMKEYINETEDGSMQDARGSMKRVSKWASYLEAESNTETKSSDYGSDWNIEPSVQSPPQTEWTDQVFEEDIHADFF